MLVSRLDELIKKLKKDYDWARSQAQYDDIPQSLPYDLYRAIEILEKISNEK